MNRRDFTKLSTFSAAGIMLNQNMLGSIHAANPGIEEIRLIHFTHCDYGYTDHPVTNIEQHVAFLKQALLYCEETYDYPESSRFHWTVEGVWTLENFWKQASFKEKQLFDKLFANGQVEVTGMPGNLSMLVKSFEWERELKRLKFFYETYRPEVVMMNDVNGVPWGMIPHFLDHGFKYLWMGLNQYGTKAPQPVPSMWNWEGPDSRKMLAWLGFAYPSGYDFFHKGWWRRGPVPAAHDIWFNPPSEEDIFSRSAESLNTAKTITRDRIEGLHKSNYPFSTLAISTTNMWRCDNDPPVRQLSDFVREWNDRGLLPRLVFSTPSTFYKNIKQNYSEKIKTLRGDWSDFWADGLAAMPSQIATLQEARRRNEDLEAGVNLLKVDISPLQEKLEHINHQLVFASEHTFDAYNSVAYPYNELCMGNECHRYGVIYEAQENTRMVKTGIMRSSPDYMPFSQTRFIEVCNPGNFVRNGWVSILGNALRLDVNAARDILSGEIYPFEEVRGYDWSEPVEQKNLPLEFPDNVWGTVVQSYRFYLQGIKPAEKRRFELVKDSSSRTKKKPYFRLSGSGGKNPFGQLELEGSDLSFFDQTSHYHPAQLIIEQSTGFKNRYNIEARKSESLAFNYSSPDLVKEEVSQGIYSCKKTLTYNSKLAKAIVQELEIVDGLPRLDITTTIWLNEQIDPVAIYMAFPFKQQNDLPKYMSFGYPTRAGKDQLPGSCGEYTVVQDGLWWEGNSHNLVLHTPDNPLVAFETLNTRNMKQVFEPKNSHLFSMICNNYWVTNLPVLRPTKLILRHVIELQESGNPVSFDAAREFWAYPVKEI
jgi:hypothetical protein